MLRSFIVFSLTLILWASPLGALLAQVGFSLETTEVTNEILLEKVETLKLQGATSPAIQAVGSLEQINDLSWPQRSSLLTEVALAETFATGIPNSCSDYYEFGSVVTAVTTDTTQSLAGSNIPFTVQITNNNSFPMVGASVYARVFTANSATPAQLQGVVDQFSALTDITIPAGETIERTIMYQTPDALPTGTYELVTYVTIADTYHLAGLPFTDDVRGGSAFIEIAGQLDGGLTFDKSLAFLNNTQYNFSALSPEFTTNTPIQISVPIRNTLDSAQDATVTWKLYSYSQQSEANLIETATQTISIASGESMAINHTVTDTQHAAYVLQGEVDYFGAKSIVTTRFTRADVEEVRINYAGMRGFPASQPGEITLFACAQALGVGSDVSDTTIELTLTDETGDIVHQASFADNISPDQTVFISDFTPKQQYQTLTVNTVLKKAGEVVSATALTYDCQNITGAACAEYKSTVSGTLFTNLTHPYTVGGVLLFLIGLLVFLRRRSQGGANREEKIEYTKPIIFFLALLLGGSAFVTATFAQPPALFTAVPGVCGSGEITITFLDDPGVLYSLQTNESSPQLLASNASAPFAGSPYVHTGLTPGSSVSYNFILFDEVTGQRLETGWSSVTAPELCANLPPNAPAIYGPTETPAGFASNYIVQAEDPERDQVYFEVDWNADGVAPFVRLPGSGSIPSMALQRFARAWFPVGPNTFWARAIDTSGNRSSWSNYTVDVLEAPAVALELSVNGGPWTASDQVITVVDTVRLRWTTNNFLSCTATNFNSGGTMNNLTGIPITNPNAGNSTLFSFRCGFRIGDWGGMMTDTVRVTTSALPLPLPVITLASNIDGGGFTAGNKVVNPGQAVAMQWSAVNATSCTGISTPGVSGISGSTGIAEPGPGLSQNYGVRCFNATGNYTDALFNTRVNAPPNRPTINGTIGGTSTAEPSQVLTFQLLASDPDNDQIFFEIDTDMDGVPNLPQTSRVNNGVAVPLTRTMPISGEENFQVRAVDVPRGLASNWTQHTVTVNLPPPTMTIAGLVNGSNQGVGPITVAPLDTLEITWSTTNASQCTASTNSLGFSTTGNSAGTDQVNQPSPGTSARYELTCTGSGGSVTQWLDVYTQTLPNLTTPNVTYNPSSDFDPLTGNYDFIDVSGLTTNNGESSTVINPWYLMSLDVGNNGSIEAVQKGNVGVISGGPSPVPSANFTGRFTNVQFGTTTITVCVDESDQVGQTNLVAESNEADNCRPLSLNFAPPDPELSITASPSLVRNSDTIDITWEAGATYPLICTVSGPGVNISPASLPGSQTGVPIGAKSEYILSCTEPSTGTVFTTSATTEVTGQIEEL